MSNSRRSASVPGYDLQQAQRDIAALRGQTSHIKAGAAINLITSGFPSGWSGYVKYKPLQEAGLAFIKVGLTLNGGTSVTTSEVICTLSNYYYGADNTLFPITVSGASLTTGQLIIQGGSGQLQWNGSPFSFAGTIYLYGQTTYAWTF